ncbi:MAG: HutD family protein [Beijerinckiaceae bacterium]
MADAVMHRACRTTLLAPSSYRRTPWKNGGGVTIDIAAGWKPGAVEGDWSGMLWRFGRTSIISPGPFSDLSGYDRAQVVVEGRGLALETPDGEIDVREPMRPVRFAGETPIVSRLEQGPVEVANLIGARDAVAIDLCVLRAGEPVTLKPALHVAYAAKGAMALQCGVDWFSLDADHALQIETESRLSLGVVAGIGLLATVVAKEPRAG